MMQNPKDKGSMYVLELELTLYHEPFFPNAKQMKCSLIEIIITKQSLSIHVRADIQSILLQRQLV